MKRLASDVLRELEVRVAKLERQANYSKIFAQDPQVKEASKWLQSQGLKNILDCVQVMYSALEESNYHTELKKLEMALGIHHDSTHPMDRVGMELARRLEWRGEASCFVVFSYCAKINKENARGLIKPLKDVGLL